MTNAVSSQPPLSRFRLRLLQLAYLIIAGGLALTLWPVLLTSGQGWPLMSGVVNAMLAAMSLLAIVGLFRPIEMLPLLMFEVGWKAIWLLRMALPLWLDGRMDAGTEQTAFECLLILPVMALIPWDVVWRRYFAPEGEA
jgi:hypothetical protein